MGKIDCVLMVLNKELFEKNLPNLSFDNVNLVAVLMDESDDDFFTVQENDIPVSHFEIIDRIVAKYQTCTWLVGGCEKEIDFRRVKNFLITLEIEGKNIVNFGVRRSVSSTWLANYSHIAKNGADFFATGDEYFREALNLDFIPCVYKNKNLALGGVNLADKNQNLRQSYSIAKNVFARVKPGTIKFVIIGLSPNYFYRSCEESFQYPDSVQNDGSADLNFDEIKEKYYHGFSPQSVLDWEEELPLVVPDFSDEKNIQILKDYIKLCLDNSAKPIGVIFPYAPTVRKIYDKKILADFRKIIHQLEESVDFSCIDMFELNLDYYCFCDMLHLNLDGAIFANTALALKLNRNGLIPIESFLEMTYQRLNRLAWCVPKDEYNEFAGNIFKASAKKISRKDKIKLGFVTIDSAQWSGDDLYNLFANDERFEVTIFDCLRTDKSDNDLITKDFWRGVEQFKERGLNVVALDELNVAVPAQDILIFLTPYSEMIPLDLRPQNLSLNTLTTHITYSFMMSIRSKNFYDRAIFHIAWKVFFASPLIHGLFARHNRVDMPRGLYSGYPRMDIFFKKNVDFKFKWKMARPNAKKIIYAPHWSINGVTKQATFQWNYKFMYEFAKAHQEISWVIKPHQALFFSVVEEKVFPSTTAYEEYLQKWNDLPNAQVYTGAYYQDLFATSNGMIHDSSSFIAEYQYVDKPMIFLTREGLQSNDLAKIILNVSYCVDGKDLDAIAAMMQKVFIEGDDYKAAERKEVYDKYLNYPKYNGMLASEFIYRNISDELKEES